jgi:hypothetical protein
MGSVSRARKLGKSYKAKRCPRAANNPVAERASFAYISGSGGSEDEAYSNLAVPLSFDRQ